MQNLYLCQWIRMIQMKMRVAGVIPMLNAKLLRELQFLTNVTRPDIAYIVNKLSAYTTNLSLQHVGAVKWILRYSKETKNLAIKYSSNSNSYPDTQWETNLFYGYADAAYANTDDYKSVRATAG